MLRSRAKTKDEPIITPPPPMNRWDWVLIVLLVAAVAVVSLARLGDRHTPVTSWTPLTQAEGTVYIDMGQGVQVSELWYRVGSVHGRGFSLYAEGGGGFVQVYHTVPAFTDVFTWSVVALDVSAQRFRLVGQPGLRLQEIAFRGPCGTQWPVYAVASPFSDEATSTAQALADEQHLIPTRRSFMNSAYFDEVYHPRAAYEYVHRLPVFETTHPPMGKNFIALSVRLLGMTPFAWRLPGTLFGIAMVPLLYAFARLLLKNNNWALFAAFIFSFDFMRFAQTRLATIDTYVTFFVLAMYLAMYVFIGLVKAHAPLWKMLTALAICGVCMGLAIASKWQGVYGALGLPFLFFPFLYKLYLRDARQAKIIFAACFGLFVAVPLGLYTLSYIPFILAMGGGSHLSVWGNLRIAWDNQFHMFDYHAHLVAEHWFASVWWQWPILWRPMWLYIYRWPDGISAGISTMGNPAVWWVGTLALVGVPVKLLWDKLNRRAIDFVPVFLLVAVAAQYVPWMGITRLTFIYHFFPTVPFMVVLLAWVCKTYLRPRWVPWVPVGYAAVVLGLFVLFYPVLAGLPVSVSFVETWLRWLPDWIFV